MYERSDATRIARHALTLVKDIPVPLKKDFYKLMKKNPLVARTLIAADAIRIVLSGRAKPRTGLYVRFHLRKELAGNVVKDKNNPRRVYLREEIVSEIIEKEDCEVCARGLCFVAAINIGNRAPRFGKFSQITPEGWRAFAADLEAKERSKEDFGEVTSQKIEAAFECSRAYVTERVFGPGYEIEVGSRCASFGHKWNDARDRALAIFANIIRNNGDFNESDNPGKLSEIKKEVL